jgi:hypothetical protein
MIKENTRDNLIYLAVGLSVAALVILDFVYSDSHGRTMWWPSNFVYRLVAYVGVLGYIVARETRKVGATWGRTVVLAGAAGILQVGVAFAFRKTFSGPYSLNLWLLWIVAGFTIVQLLVWIAGFFDSGRRGS